MTTEEISVIEGEIDKLYQKRVIEQSYHEHGQYISPIFIRPKKDGGYRMILDLSDLNKNTEYHHFKMDTFQKTVQLITEGCFMASIDLRDAYYSVPIAVEHRKYLKFSFEGKLWQFRALPNGLSTGPRLFTKLLKPPFAYLRAQGHNVLGYIDDTIIIANSKEAALKAISETSDLLTQLGFIIHQEKSQFSPVQQLQYLGFIINSKDMTVTLPSDKKATIIDMCTELYNEQTPTIRQVAKVIGKLVAAFPAVEFGPLYYRTLERDKSLALKQNNGHFDRHMRLSDQAKQELIWWIHHIGNSLKNINQRKPDLELQTDASGIGWGATNLLTHTGGKWKQGEELKTNENNINYLELVASFYGLKSFCTNMRNVHVRLRLDNTTAVAYINHMGGSKSSRCNGLAKQMWEWCNQRHIWISAAHLPGKQNTIADFQSRKFNDQTEWMLNKNMFKQLIQIMGVPKVDLFASRLNNQLPNYVSWLPDPGAIAVDAFSLDWGPLEFYAFPPFCLIGRCLQKVNHEKAEGLLIAPNWPTQPWYPLLMSMSIQEPVLIHKHPYLLTQPVSQELHPLHDRLDLLCCRISGQRTKPQVYQRQQFKSLRLHGGLEQENNTTCT